MEKEIISCLHQIRDALDNIENLLSRAGKSAPVEEPAQKSESVKETPSSDSGLTKDYMRATLGRMTDVDVIGIMNGMGWRMLREVPPERYADLLRACEDARKGA